MGDLLRFDPIARRVGSEPARRRLDELVEAPDAAEQVRALDPLYLYGLVHEVGVDASLPVLHLTSGEQVQALVDFDCWDGDRFSLDRLEGWLAAHLQGPIDHVAELHAGLDPELLGLLFQGRIEVYFYEDEEDAELIDRIEGPIESSPDGVYAIVMPEQEREAELLRALIKGLYVTDQDAARQLLHHARHELRSQLAATAYQMRSGRIEQSGFLPFDEALEIVAPVQPARERRQAAEVLADDEAPTLSLRLDGPVAVPVALADEILRITDDDGGSFAGRALRRAVDQSGDLAAADTLLMQLTSLVNRSVVVDRGRPGDPDDTRAAMARTHAMLGVGLEYLSGGQVDAAARLLQRWPLKRVFRTGFSLVASLASQARALADSGTLSLVDELRFGLCAADEANLLEGLLEARPVRSVDTSDDFSSLSQVEAAARTLALLAYKSLWAFAASGQTRDELARVVSDPDAGVRFEEIGFDSLLATRAALHALGVGELRLLSLEELTTLVRDDIRTDALSERLAEALDTVAAPPASADPSAAALATRFGTDVTVRLLEEYGRLRPEAVVDAPDSLPPLLLWRR